MRFGGIEVVAPEVYEADELDRVFVRARRVTLRLVAKPLEREPDVEVIYALEDGWPYLLVTTVFTNRGTSPIDVDLFDSIRADVSFETCPDNPGELFWTYDRHFGQAYGVVAESHKIMSASGRRILLRYQNSAGKEQARLAPGETYRLARRVFPGANLFDIRRVANSVSGKKADRLTVKVQDASSRPISGADVALTKDGKPTAWGRTDPLGQVMLDVGDQAASLSVSAIGHGSKVVSIPSPISPLLTVALPDAAVVVGRITNEQRRADSLQGAVHRQGRHAHLPILGQIAGSTRSRTFTTVTTEGCGRRSNQARTTSSSVTDPNTTRSLPTST